MIRREFAAEAKVFRVTLGHMSVLVQAADEQQALLQARQKLCSDLPRLWDVITTMEASRFQVESL